MQKCVQNYGRNLMLDIKTTKASAADVAKAKALRVEGEKLHKDGTHDKSEKALKDALKLIGSKV